jgi:alkanesulfonate monooxygenase
LVGSYETVTQAILDYHDLGFEIFGLRGYDFVADAIEFGRHVIPLLQQEVAHRERGKSPEELRAGHAAERRRVLSEDVLPGQPLSRAAGVR